MNKKLISVLLCTLLMPIYTANAKSENVKLSFENSDCKIQKGVKITYKLSSENPNEKLMNSLVSIISKRLNYIDVCYKKIEWKDDNITVMLPEFDSPEKISQFLSERVELKLKTQVIDPATGQVKTDSINNNNQVVWKDSIFVNTMITDTNFVDNETSQKNFQVTFNLNKKGFSTFNEIEEKMMYQYFMIEINDYKVGALIVEENDDQPLGIIMPVVQKSNNSIIVKNLSKEVAEKFKDKQAKLKFKEIVLGPDATTPLRQGNRFVWSDSQLTNSMVLDSKIDLQKSKAKDIILSFKLNKKGSEVLKQLTEKFKDKSLAIEINNQIVSEPVITEVITGEYFVINGKLSEELINDIVNNKAKIKFKEPVIDSKTGEQQYNNNEKLWKDSLLDVNMITEVVPESNDDNRNAVRVTLNEEGKKKFSELTKSLINKPIGIEINGKIISAPIVNEEINTGRFDISISANEKEAKKFAAQLKSGQPQASLKVVKIESF